MNNAMLTYAHPYASALYEIALQSDTVLQWQNKLLQLSNISICNDYNDLISNPTLNKTEVIELLLQLMVPSNESNDIGLRNFLTLLQKNNRLMCLQAIYQEFQGLVEKSQNIAKVLLLSAFPMSELEQQLFIAVLSKKIAKKIVLKIEVSPELIGGVKIIIDDKVIDASVKGSLEKLATAIVQ